MQIHRLYIQNGTQADSGALFLATSKEEDLQNSHTISPNGYNIGRCVCIAIYCDGGAESESNSNELCGSAIGTSRNDGVTYYTTANNVTGLLAAGSEGVNHGQ